MIYVENLIYIGVERGGKLYGKNLIEGGFEGSGMVEGLLFEFGSEDDLGWLVFRKLVGVSVVGSGVVKGWKELEGRKGFL